MQHLKKKIQNINWPGLAESMNEKGFAMVPGFLPAEDCAALLADYNNPVAYRKNGCNGALSFWQRSLQIF